MGLGLRIFFLDNLFFFQGGVRVPSKSRYRITYTIISFFSCFGGWGRAFLGKPLDLSEAISSAPVANHSALPLACSYQFNPARLFSSNASQHRIEGRGTSHLRIAKGQLMAVNSPAVSTPNNVLPLPPKGLLCGAPPQATAATPRSRSSRKSQSSSQSKQAVAQTATPSSHVSPPPPVQQQQQGILMQSADHPLV